MAEVIEIRLPEEADRLRQLKAGDEVRLSGTLYTMRDAGHERCLAYLHQEGKLPFGLKGQTLFYAGPTPPRAGLPFGAIGPTTASRMDFATPELYQAGIVATIGKGKRSTAVAQACMDYQGVYLAAVGGVAALLATCVTSAECIGWEDLGTEALFRIELEGFAAFVEVDTQGADLYRQIEEGSSLP